jgi:hypothetical protein
MAARINFSDFSRRFRHFYPLSWPFPKPLAAMNSLLAPLWGWKFSRSRISRFGSTVVVRFRAWGWKIR